jgi:phosphoenolpyruvate carboxylase
VVDTRINIKEGSNSNTETITGVVTEVETKEGTKGEEAISSNHTTRVEDIMKVDLIQEEATKGLVEIALAMIEEALVTEVEEVKALCVVEEEIAWEASNHSIDSAKMVSLNKWVGEDRISSTL